MEIIIYSTYDFKSWGFSHLNYMTTAILQAGILRPRGKE